MNLLILHIFNMWLLRAHETNASRFHIEEFLLTFISWQNPLGWRENRPDWGWALAISG